MKLHASLLLAFCLGSLQSAQADLTIPSDGSDGALNVTQDTVIDLAQAVTGKWDQNNAANAGKGVYDPEKWAIIFKYSSVNIAGETAGVPSQLVGRTLRFTNHPSRAPVVWLVQGNVTINGIVSLRGEGTTRDSVLMLTPREPGPGGFRGGAYGPSGSGEGYGPGGQGEQVMAAAAYLGAYGNPQIIPLIGGSGSRSRAYWGSAAGGGAILIAAAGGIAINGIIDARAGEPGENVYPAADGAIKLIGNAVTGNGTLNAPYSGRIRVETKSPMSTDLKTFPETIGVPPADPPILWPAANAPKARIVSVDAVAAPEDPTSPVVAAADLAIQNNEPVNILIETKDFPIEGVVQLAVIPKFGGRSWMTATRVSGDITKATWRVITSLPQGFVTLQARATQP